jgi:hypothetical protein
VLIRQRRPSSRSVAKALTRESARSSARLGGAPSIAVTALAPAPPLPPMASWRPPMREGKHCPQIMGQASNSKDLELQPMWHDFIESHCVSTEVTNRPSVLGVATMAARDRRRTRRAPCPLPLSAQPFASTSRLARQGGDRPACRPSRPPGGAPSPSASALARNSFNVAMWASSTSNVRRSSGCSFRCLSGRLRGV